MSGSSGTTIGDRARALAVALTAMPALAHDGKTMIERPAILQWIETNWPTPPVLRADEDGKAVVRAMLACGAAAAAHPAFVAARPAKQLDAPR